MRRRRKRSEEEEGAEEDEEEEEEEEAEEKEEVGRRLDEGWTEVGRRLGGVGRGWTREGGR